MYAKLLPNMAAGQRWWTWVGDLVRGAGSGTWFGDLVRGPGSGTWFGDLVRGPGSGTWFGDLVRGPGSGTWPGAQRRFRPGQRCRSLYVGWGGRIVRRLSTWVKAR